MKKVKFLFKNKEENVTKYAPFILLGIIILLAVFFRLYNFPYRYGLGDETVREAIIGIEGARQLQAPLTGGFSSAGPFTWGPWFYYQMILVSLILPYNYAPWIYLSLTSLICIVLLYKIGVQLNGKMLGLLLAFFGALSPALLISSTHLTFPNLTNVFALFAIFLFIKLIQHEVSYWWSFLFGLVLGIAINIHYQMAGLLILPILLLLYRYKKPKYFLFCCFGIGFTFLPLLLFDLTNHWHNTKNILDYYLHGRERIYVPNRWLFYVRDFWPAFWGDVIGIPRMFAAIFMIVSFSIIVWQIIKRNISVSLLLLSFAFVFNFILLRYYWGERFFGYLNHLRPFVFIFTGFAIVFLYRQLSKRVSSKISFGIIIILITFLSFFILPQSIKMLEKDAFSLQMYGYVTLLKKQYPDKKFTIYHCAKSSQMYEAGIVKSLVFLFDMEKKLSTSGEKIAVASTFCTYPDPSDGKKQDQAVKIDNTSLLNLSHLSASAIKKSYWKPYTFQDTYDSTARWWFREQP